MSRPRRFPYMDEDETEREETDPGLAASVGLILVAALAIGWLWWK